MEYRNPQHYEKKLLAFQRKNYPVASQPHLFRGRNHTSYSTKSNLFNDNIQKEKIAVIKSQLFDNIQDELRSLQRSKSRSPEQIKSNKSGQNSLNRYLSTSAFKSPYSQVELKSKQLTKQNNSLKQANSKLQRDILHLKNLLSSRQQMIQDKQLIIRRFINNKTNFNFDETEKLKLQLIKSKQIINSLKKQIQAYIQSQQLMQSKVSQLQRKMKLPEPIINTQKQYQSIIDLQRQQLFEIEQKTRKLKYDLRRREELKKQVFSLKQQIRQYQSKQMKRRIQRLVGNDEPLKETTLLKQNQLQILSQLGDLNKYNKNQLKELVDVLINKLKNRYLKMKQKQKQFQQSLELEQRMKDKIELLEKQRLLEVKQLKVEIKKLQEEVQNGHIKIDNDLKTISEQNYQINTMNKDLKEAKLLLQKLQNSNKQLKEQILSLSSKNIQLNEQIIENISELQIIEKTNNEMKITLEQEKLRKKKKQQDFNEMKEMLNEKSDIIDEMKDQLRQLMVQNQMLSEKMSIIEDEKNKIIQEIQSQKEKSQIRENMKNDEWKNSWEVLSEQKDKLKNLCNQKQQKIKQLTDQIQKTVKQNHGLKSQIQERNKQIQIIQQISQDLEVKLNKAEEQIQKLNLLVQKNTTLENQKQAIQSKLQYLEVTSKQHDQDLMNSLNQLRTINNKILLNNQSLKNQIQVLQSLIEQLFTKLNTQQLLIFGLSQLADQFYSDHQNQKLKTIALSSQNQILTLNISKLLTEKQNISSQLQILISQNSQISSQNTKYQIQIQNLNKIIQQRDNQQSKKLQSENDYLSISQKVIKVLNELQILFNHPECDSSIKQNIVNMLNSMGIIPQILDLSNNVIQEHENQNQTQQIPNVQSNIVRRSDRQKQPTFVKVFSQQQISTISNNQIKQIVFNYLGINNKLSNNVLQFLKNIMKFQDVVVGTDEIQQLCMGISDFQKQIQEKMKTLELAVEMYLNKANQVFYYSQQEIQNASEYKSVQFSDAESFKSEVDFLPQFTKNLNIQSQLKPNFQQRQAAQKSFDKNRPINERSFLDMKKMPSASMIHRKRNTQIKSSTIEPMSEIGNNPKTNMKSSGYRTKTQSDQQQQIKQKFKDSCFDLESSTKLKDKQAQKKKKNMLMNLSKSAIKKTKK